MEIYVVYQLGYTGTNQLDILGIYKDIRWAEEKYFKTISDNIAEFDFGLDKECNDIVTETSRMTRLFKGGCQENWDNYLEIHIEKQEVK